jgi:alpha-N-arabinofuranosidase
MHMAWKFLMSTTLITWLVGAVASGREVLPDTSSLTVHADQTGPLISRDLFGQFAEQLGHGIYGGVWVGKDSKIPNVRGIRSDVVQALKELRVPNVRWPGGCFADKYHWRDGIGPADRRPTTYNINWGSNLEPNIFGTHEFMDFVEQIGSEAYITVNVGSGSAQEAADWLEYMTTDQPTTLGKERVANGRRAPFHVKYLGIGNESWGCGGAMTPETYVDRMKIYSMYARNLDPAQSGASRFIPGPNPMQRIAVGPADGETEYTEAVMKAWQRSSPRSWGIEGVSLHHYTSGASGTMRDAATGFGEKEYAAFVKQTYVMDELIAKHSTIMNQYDPQKKVALVVDEWGVWLQSMPGTQPLFLQQQNSLRDAILASLNLNIFARHADRVRMANIAQMVNVLQAMILTDNEKMLLTPTYHVYKMYLPFQDARSIPIAIEAGEYKVGDLVLPRIDGIAARTKDGQLWLALTNIDQNRAADLTTNVEGLSARTAVGEVLTAAHVDTVNTFESPRAVSPQAFRAQAVGGRLVLHLLPKSVTVMRLEE